MLQSKGNIGRLDRRITFQAKVIGTNESNEDEEDGWQDISNPEVWAQREEPTGARMGDEEYRADKLTAYQDVSFIIRFRSDLNTRMRILDSGVPYDILSIEEVSRKAFLKIRAASGLEYQETST